MAKKDITRTKYPLEDNLKRVLRVNESVVKTIPTAIPYATRAEADAGVLKDKVMNPDVSAYAYDRFRYPGQHSAGKGTRTVTLTDAATITVDCKLSNVFRVTLGGNRTLAAPTNPYDGQVINIKLNQDGTGGRTLAWSSAFRFVSGYTPVLSTAANARDLASMQWDEADGKWDVSFLPDFTGTGTGTGSGPPGPTGPAGGTGPTGAASTVPGPTGPAGATGPSGNNSYSWKDPVRAATTAAGTLATSFANAQVIDGVTLATGDRILIKNQAAGAENGIYVVAASGAPTRATDMDASAEVLGCATLVMEGTTNGDKMFFCSTNAPITLGTTALVFSQISGGASLPTGGTTGQALVKNSATDGDAGWATISGGGSAGAIGSEWTLLNTQTASASAQLDFTGIDSTKYEQFLIVVNDLVLSTTAELGLRAGTSTGPTWDTAANYDSYVTWAGGTSGAGSDSRAFVSATSDLRFGTASSISSPSGKPLNGQATLVGLASGANMRVTLGMTDCDGGSGLIQCLFSGVHNVTTAITGLRLYPSAGTITRGKAMLYGRNPSALPPASGYITGTGAGTTNIDAPPASPEAIDDEFDGAALASKWTWANQNAATATVSGGILQLGAGSVNNIDSLSVLHQSVSGDFTVVAKQDNVYFGSATDVRSGLFLRDSVSGKCYAFGRWFNSGVCMYVNRQSSISAYTSQLVGTGGGTGGGAGHSFFFPALYLRIRVASGTIYFDVSLDGVLWGTVGSETTAAFLGAAPNQVGVFISRSTDANGKASYGWFRKIGSSYAPGTFVANDTLPDPANFSVLYQTDFVNQTFEPWSSFTQGGSSVSTTAVADAERPGVLRASSNSSDAASGSAVWSLTDSVFTNSRGVGIPSTDVLVIDALLRVNVVTPAHAGSWQFGLLNFGTNTYHVYVEGGLTSTFALKVRNAAGGAGLTTTTMSVTPSNNTWFRLRLEMKQGMVKAYINNTLAATCTTTIPASTDLMVPGMLASNNSVNIGATPVILDMDWMRMHRTFSTPRA